MDTIALPAPRQESTVSVEAALAARRSVRAFAAEPLTLEETAQLLWAGQGITDPARGFRTNPSAGATFPMSLYLVNADGVFRYEPAGHQIVPVRQGDQRPALQQAALNQTSIVQAPATIVVVADYARTTPRYGDRGIRFVHIEAGHIAQSIQLQALALGLASVPVGAFSDDDVGTVLGLPGELSPLYLIPVGRAAR